MALMRFADRDLDTMIPGSFSRMLDNLFNEQNGNSGRLSRFSPAVDIVENEKQYEVRIVMPGMKKEDFKIELTNDVLTVSGERQFEKEDKGKTYHRIESQYGSFSRSFNLPEDVVADSIEANYKDGMLMLSLPKDTQKSASRNIKVK